MSVKVSSLVWDAEFDTHAEKLIALRLADHSNDDGHNIFPSIAHVAKKTGVGRSTVYSTLQKFKRAGILRVVKEGGGRANTTHYRLDIATLRAMAAGDGRWAADEKNGPTAGPFREYDETANGPATGPFNAETVQPLDETVQPLDLEPSLTAKEKEPSKERARKRASAPKKPRPSSGNSAKRRLTPLPDDFDPTELREFAAKLGLPESEIDVALSKWKCVRLSEGKRRADWTKDGQGYLLSWANNLKRDAKSGRRAPANTDDAFTMAERGGLH